MMGHYTIFECTLRTHFDVERELNQYNFTSDPENLGHSLRYTKNICIGVWLDPSQDSMFRKETGLGQH